MSGPFTKGQFLTADELNAALANFATLDSTTGELAVTLVPAAVTAAIAAAVADATAAATQAAAAATTAANAATTAAAAQTAAAAAAVAASSGATQRPWAVFAGNVAPTGTDCQLLASFGIDHVVHTAAGLYEVYLDADHPLPADVQISGGDALPAWGCSVSGYIGILPSGTDDTVILGGLNRQPTQPWGKDATSGLSYIQVRTTYQSQQISSTTGVDWDAVFVRLFW